MQSGLETISECNEFRCIEQPRKDGGIVVETWATNH